MTEIVRDRPLVMISSTITELADVRAEIADQLEAAGLADGWLFEFHAPAAGAPAEERYLGIARTCDLYVLLIAEQHSGPTEAEYHAAYEDNPRKVLPFFVGKLTPQTREWRELIELRHTRIHREKRADLPGKVVAAVTDAVRTGELVRPTLMRTVETEIGRAEQVAGSAIPLAFLPHLASTKDLTAPPLRPGTKDAERDRLVLEGIGGSGKTFASLVAAHRAGQNGRLPLILRPTAGGATITSLIATAFERARYHPGSALIGQLANDGLLCVVVDGADALGPDQRRELMTDLDDFASRYPRSQIICCVRRLLPGELPSFDTFTLQPLTDEQTTAMFQAAGAPQLTSFPTQVSDLARWPLWAWALLEVGPSAQSGLVLLRELIARRVAAAGVTSPIETDKLTEAASAIAHAYWPEPFGDPAAAMSTIAAWAGTPDVATRFTVGPADTLLTRLSATGLIRLTTEITFAHPLFATFLAASHAARGHLSAGMEADAEFAMFVAAMLPASEDDQRVNLLGRHGPVGQARFLRLVPPEPRTPQPDDPLRFAEAVQILDGDAAECIVTDDWTAWRTAAQPGAVDPTDIDNWVADAQLNVMAGNIFAQRTPIEVAAIESLARYKKRVVQLDPNDRHVFDTNEDVLRHIKRMGSHEHSEAVIEAMLDWRSTWRESAAAMGIATLPEVAIPEGDPQVVLHGTELDPDVELTWGAGAKVEQVPSGEAPWRYRPLSRYLEPGRADRIYRELTQIAERALGCTFGSQSWSRPELVASWAW